MKDYYDFYLKVDVILLLVVFDTVTRESINSFKFHPPYYLSTPDCSWDPMLNFTSVKLGY